MVKCHVRQKLQDSLSISTGDFHLIELHPDRQQAEVFIERLTGSKQTPVTFQTFDDLKGRNRPEIARVIHGPIDENYGELCRLNREGAGIFITVNQTDLLGRKRKNIKDVRAFFADNDTGPLPIDLQLKPSIRVKTKAGEHVYWILAKPLEMQVGMQEGFETIQKCIIKELDTDKTIVEINRVMRMPGFNHMKDPSNPVLIAIGDINDLTYELSDVERVFCPGGVDFIASQSIDHQPTVAESGKTVRYDLSRAIEYLTLEAPIAIEGEHGDATTIQVANRLGDWVEQETAFALMSTLWNPRCLPPWSSDELRAKARSAFKSRQSPIGCTVAGNVFGVVTEPPDEVAETSERKIIDTDDIPLDELASRAERALIDANVNFYARGSSVVQPVVEVAPSSKGRLTTVARLKVVSAHSMVDYLSRVASFTRHNARKNRKVKIAPPRIVADTILSREGDWRFRKLAGVITCQTLRPDGSVLDKAGYDESTQLLLAHCPDLPEIPSRPKRRDAEAALDLLQDLLNEFPFVDPASKSVALSSMISAIVRGAMTVSPLHAITSPSAGSGKSLANDLVSAIITGQPCPVIAAGRTEEETEKRLVSALLSGQPIISIDNVNGELGGDALCQIIERPYIEVRRLGLSELVRIENKAIVLATGNNIHLVGDMVRRTLLCRLDPELERPELRQFRKNPLELILDNRGRYISAGLVIVRAYIEARFPNLLPPLASFGDWSRLVRSPLVWLGCADPVATIEIARSEDPETSQLAEVVTAWATQVGVNTPLTVGELLLKGQGALGDALRSACNDGERLDGKRLSWFLRRHKGRIVQGLKLVGETDSHAKQIKWALRPLRV